MTQTARIIIIGGGIVGVSTLYHLAKAGEKDALLLERKELTSGATWHAAGNVHTQSAFANLSALQAYSLRLYDGLAEEVGQDVGSHVVGGFFLAQTKERMEEFKHLAGKFKGLGLEYELVGPEDIKAKYPLLNVSDLEGGAWDPEEGYVDPYSVTMGLAAGARQYGGKIKRNCQVEAIERLSNGHWRLRAGEEIFECEILVNCAGFWANEVANMVGARLPITNMEHHYLVTETIPEIDRLHEELPMIRDTDSGWYMRQEGKGLLFGPWEKNAVPAWGNNGAPWDFGQELFENNLDRLEEGLMTVYHRVPVLEETGVKRIVNGAISFAPDGRPMIGSLPGIPNYFVACGFLGGIAQGGGIGLAMSQWILEGESELDLHFIDVARFGDWTSKEFARARTMEIYPRRYEIIYPHQERSAGRNLKMSPIHQDLLDRGAVMGQAYGWERPLWYAPDGRNLSDEPSFQKPNWWEHVGAEAKAMARGVGLSDMTSYGKFRVSGPDALACLNFIGSAKVPERPGKMALSLLLNDRAGIVGDVTIENSGDGSYYLVGATTGVALYHRWMEAHIRDLDVRVDNITDHYAVLGVAGPNSRALLNHLSDHAFDDFAFMTSKNVEIGPVRVKAMRVSFSGEMGWELHMPMASQKAVFDQIMTCAEQFGVGLLGSRAMGHLRIEKGYRSWGAEMTTEVTPHAAGLQAFCAQSKHYIGKSVVDAQRLNGPDKHFITLIMPTETPPCWGTEPVYSGESIIGYVTSGGMGWRIGKMLAIAWVDGAKIIEGEPLSIEILQEKYPAEISATPIYDPENHKLRS